MDLKKHISPVDVSEIEKESINIYPNPFSNTIYIETSETKEVTLELISIDGKVCWKKRIFTNSEIVVPSYISKGSYIISIEDSNGNTRSVHTIKE